MNTLTPGRTDSAAYDADAGQSLADEQRLETKARELAAEAFTSGNTMRVRSWLLDAAAGECSMAAHAGASVLLFAAVYESSADLTLAVDRLRECFVDECNEDYDADAAESLAAEDADAADFEGEA